MATNNTKAYNPVLYPLDRAPAKLWFISYEVDNWEGNGGFKKQKYSGLLNRTSDLKERERLAAKYCKMLTDGEPMPNYQGCRSKPVKVENAGTTNVISCCERFLANIKANIKNPGKNNEGYSKATYQQYKAKLNNFYAWLKLTKKDRRAIGGIDELDAQDFLLWLKTDKNLCNHTWNAYKMLLAAIWKGYRKYIKDNPWADIKSRKGQHQHHKSYPPQLQQRITETLPVYDYQLWIFMQCVYYTGIRPGELRLLKAKHINTATGRITVPAEISKTGKERHVNVYHKLLQQLTSLGYHLNSAHYYLFSYNGIPGPVCVGKNYFSRKWEKYRNAFEIPAEYKLYGSKHTAGKKLTLQTNLYITKEHFGHSGYDATSHYVNDLNKNELNFLQESFPEFAT